MLPEITDLEIEVLIKKIFPIEKQKYFMTLAFKMRKALGMHKLAGLFDDWTNVPAHCLLATARVEVIGKLLKLDDELIHDMMVAATLHDFGKKLEKEIVTIAGPTWKAFEYANSISTLALKNAGFSQRIIRIASASGHGSLIETVEIVTSIEPSDEDLACLIFHYVDDYTINDKPVTPFSDGKNDFTRRMENNVANKRYKILDEEGRIHFSGASTFEAQERIGRRVQEKLTFLMIEAEGDMIAPNYLPEYVEEILNNEIATA